MPPVVTLFEGVLPIFREMLSTAPLRTRSTTHAKRLQAAIEPDGEGSRTDENERHWLALFEAAGFAIGDEELDVIETMGDMPAAVHLCISAVDAPPLVDALQSPVSVFNLAQRPFTLRRALRSARVHSAADGTRLTRRIVRAGNVTRCTLVPFAETTEWAEREQARRARQRLPKAGRQMFKLRGTRDWVDDRQVDRAGDQHG